MDLKDKVKEIWGRMSTGMKVVAVAVVVMVLFAAAASANELVEGVEPRDTLYDDNGYTVEIYPADTICLSTAEATQHITSRGGLPLLSEKGTVRGDDEPMVVHVFVFPDSTGESWTLHTSEADTVCLRTYVYEGLPS